MLYHNFLIASAPFPTPKGHSPAIFHTTRSRTWTSQRWTRTRKQPLRTREGGFDLRINLLPEGASILPGHHQDKKRREQENGATDGSQHPLATFCMREKTVATEPMRWTQERNSLKLTTEIIHTVS